jgi:hypothetical protein
LFVFLKRCWRFHMRAHRPKPFKTASQTPALHALAAAVVLAWLPHGAAQAGTITVDNTNCTLANAINAANIANGGTTTYDPTTGNAGTTPHAVGQCTGATAGSNTIVLNGNTTLNARYVTTFGLPVVTSSIVVLGNGHTLARDTAGGTPTFALTAVTGTTGRLTLDRVKVTGFSGNGALLAVQNGAALTLLRSTLSNNSTNYVVYVGGSGSTAKIDQTTVANNTVGISGTGAIHATGSGSVEMVNSTISGNSGSQSGGGLVVTGGTATVLNSTITGNTATFYGGVYLSSGTLTLRNSIVAGNTATGNGGPFFIHELGSNGIPNNITSSNNVLGHSGRTTADSFNGFNPSGTDKTATSNGTVPTALAGILSTTLADNGGPTQTHALAANSPAIDASGTSATTVDQRGYAVSGGTRDVGAHEASTSALPFAPFGLTATPGNGQATVAFFSGGTPDNSAITNYEYSTDGTNFTAFNPAVTTSPVSVTGLTNGQASTLYLRALVGTTPGAASAGVSVTPVANAAPVASNVAITGTAQVGVQLTGSYTYADAESDAQGTSTFRWLSGANPIGGATATTYTPVVADVGNALKFCVTPVASAGTATGAEVCSTATANVVAAPANGACGTAANVASATAPAANLCSVGSAGAVTGVGGQWGWSCSGSNGGQAASCTAPYGLQTLSISANPTSITFGGTSVITASSSAGLSVALAPNANCTLAGTTATGTAAGTCTVTASQAGTGDNGTLRYQAASTQSANITVGKAAQAITGFSANPTSIGVGATSTLSATKGAGSAAVVYSSKTTATCTVAGNTVTAVTAGTCTVAANQAESANHNAAPEVTANITVTNAAPIASNVAVTGTAQVGVQLTGSYTYSDPESDAQGTSTFRWVRQSNPTVDVATTQNYTPVAADVGNALKFCVTPKASAGTATGTEVCSTATASVVAAPANGACGSAANQASATAPAANLCSVGTAGAVNVLGTNWGWSCSGTNGGNANSCTAPFANTNTGSGNTTTTVGAIQAANSNNWQINTAVSGFVALPAPAPAGVTLPAGATKVVLNTGTPGTSTTVTLRFSSIPEGAQLYKYGKENGINDTAKWFAYPATIDRAAGTVTYTLTDGQKGDNDWTVNGVIDDPVGLGVAAAGGAGAGISGVPTLSEWAMALLAGFMLLVGARQVRRRH